MAIKKRCIFCRKVVRPDGTCQNEKCVLYVPEKTEEPPAEPVTTPEEGTSTEN
ncbi:MAG: hypothetical protein PUB49_05180 [Selenomonadaceae bacterium]|nr:hypothetical protein [Selenomonadaceae bacterium]